MPQSFLLWGKVSLFFVFPTNPVRSARPCYSSCEVPKRKHLHYIIFAVFLPGAVL